MHLSMSISPKFHWRDSASFVMLRPMTWEAPQQPPAVLLLLRDLSMVCIARLTVGNEQPHGAPFPEKRSALWKQRLALS